MMHYRQNTKFKSKRKGKFSLHNIGRRTSLAVQGLRLHVSNEGGGGSIPGQETKIPYAYAEQCDQTTYTHTHIHIYIQQHIYIHTHAHIYLYIHIYIVRNVLEKFILNVDRLQFWLGKFWKPLLKRSTGWLSLFSTDHTNRNPLFQWRKTALSLRSAEGDIF